ncbi:MAG: hypothetical protein AB1512_19125 [Thermodesulfobacteriota bacterium]
MLRSLMESEEMKLFAKYFHRPMTPPPEEATDDLAKEPIDPSLAATHLETLHTPAKFGPNNVAVTPSGCLQWVKGDKFPFRAAMVANGNYKSLPVKEKMISIPEIRNKAKSSAMGLTSSAHEPQWN